jgi:iron-sulfur cluster insertion protein
MGGKSPVSKPLYHSQTLENQFHPAHIIVMTETYGIIVEDTAIARIGALRTKQNLSGDHYLRIAVIGGGCSGFQYEMSMDDMVNDDDLVFDEAVVIDHTSRQMLRDAVIAYKEDLMGAQFVIENPNATSSCGCGSSFAV